MSQKEYKVEIVEEGGCATFLLGSARFPKKKFEKVCNDMAADGWEVVFQVMESRRFMLFFSKEACIVTFARDKQ
jgi:hypothetical protein